MIRNKIHLLRTLVTDRPENHEFASIFGQKRILTNFARFQMPYFMLIFKFYNFFIRLPIELKIQELVHDYHKFIPEY